MSSKGRPASRIAGVGGTVPEKVLTNADLEKMVNTSDEWITTRTGIKERRIVEPGTPNSELASDASMKALNEAGIEPEQIDLIVMGTVTGDYKFPSAAGFVQARIGAKNAAAFDISAACSGWIYSLQIADMAIRTGQAKTVLAIGSEILTSMVDWSDRSTCVLFGDGAGAAVVVPATDEKGILSSYIGANGKLAHLLYCAGGGSVHPGTNRDLPPDMFTMKMAGNEVFKHAVKTMGDAAMTALELAGVRGEDIDLLVPHQANMRIMDATARRIHLPREKVMVTITRFGNTSTSSIPLAIYEAKKEGRIKDGTLALLVAFGGGFTWGSSVIRF